MSNRQHAANDRQHMPDTKQQTIHMWEVPQTARLVAENSRLVHVEPAGVNRFVRLILSKEFCLPGWDASYHYQGKPEDTVAYLLVLDTINFCFWPEPGREVWEIEYRGKSFSGYYGLALALKRTLESGTPLINADYLATVSRRELKRVLTGRGELQLLDERVHNLNELGEVLLADYHGAAHHMVEAAGGSALALVRLLAATLSSYRDVAQYHEDLIYFYKRAQLFAADLSGALRGAGWGAFFDSERLTAFADYKLPQVLRHLHVLQYAPELEQKVDQRVLLTPGSPEEVEIRANTIWSVELIRQELEDHGIMLRAYEIDWMLWNMGQEEKFRVKPYHRTKTIFY